MKWTEVAKAIFDYLSKLLLMLILILLFLDLAIFGSLELKKVTTSSNHYPESFRSAADYQRIKSDYDSLEDTYMPYSVWGFKRHRSKAVNVEVSNGYSYRRTLYNSKKPKYVIWFFGGSAAFGSTAANDGGTIASQLSEKLNDSGKQVYIYNFAMSAYHSTQEFIQLFQLIKSGAFRKPNLVIFYDGFNDAQVVVQALKYHSPADYHANYVYIKDLFEHPFSAWLGKTMLYLGASKLFSSSTSPKEKVASGSMDVSVDKQVQVYLLNIKIAEDLGKMEGFKVLCFIQPSLYQKKAKTKYEQWVLKTFEEKFPHTGKVVRAFYKQLKRVAKSRDKNIYFADDVFSKARKNIFVDEIHMTTKGFKEVTKRMIPVVEEKLASR